LWRLWSHSVESSRGSTDNEREKLLNYKKKVYEKCVDVRRWFSNVKRRSKRREKIADISRMYSKRTGKTGITIPF
jgi:hypothetical protein